MESTKALADETTVQDLGAAYPADRDWQPESIDVLGFIASIVRQWRFIVPVTLVFFALSVLRAFTIQPYYEGRASFMPPIREASPFGGTAVGPSQILALSGVGFGPGAAYLGFLRSRSVQDDVAQQLHVQEKFHLRDSEQARDFVASKAGFDVQTNGIITVTARDKSPEFATQITNAYLVALYKLNQRMSASAVSQRREFYDEEVKLARESLEKAEASLITTQERGGIIDPAGVNQVALSAQARLQSSIQASEVQLAGLLQSQTPESPEVVRLRSQIGQLRAQFAQQQSSSANAGARGLTAGGALPRLSLESTRSQREVREREAIYEALLRQADVSRLSETDPGPQLQVVDTAVVPLRKAGPSRRLIIFEGTLAGLFLSLLYAGSHRWVRRNYTMLRSRVLMGA